ncbi:MAG: GAF domain-containing protein [Chloroflexi bacterium]|nr:MAG: GAF domain-containing protein [Chloroflexota bacterium]
MIDTTRSSIGVSDLETLVWHLAELRERFLTSGEVDLPPIRAVIRDSWRRCRELAVNAELKLARLVLPGDQQLADLREQYAPLLRAASPVVLRLQATLGSAGYVVAISDSNGTLLDVDGDPDCRRRLARKGLVPGSNWSEAAAGTNAIGVALATGRVVQLIGAEHYCAGWHDVTCTAAPIMHPDDGHLIGVLDITGDYRLARPLLTGVMAAAAAEIQRRYRLERGRQPIRPRTFPGWTPPSPATLHLVKPLNQPNRLDRLAGAIRTVSSTFDPLHTPLVIAEQMGQLLDAAGVALIEGISTAHSHVHIWIAAGSDSTQIRNRLQAIINEPVIQEWRTSTELFVHKPDHYPELAGFPLVDIGGVIIVCRPEHQQWTTIDKQCGATLAAHCAALLRYARLYTDLQAYAAQTDILNTLAFFLSTLLDPMRQLDAVVQRILALTHLDAGFIMLKAEQRTLLAGYPSLALEPMQLTALVEMVNATGQPVWLCCQHATASLDVPMPLKEFCDVVALPLVVHAIGSGILVIGSRTHRHISGEDLTLLLIIAQQLGLTLSNAHLRQTAGENEALRQANRLKSAFLASVSHDLRSPLTAIRASVEDLIERQPTVSAGEHRALLVNIARETARLSRFVDQLLDLSRIEAGTLPIDREWVELGALINDVVANMRQQHPDCRIETLISPTLPLLYIDPVLISQVCWNLIENARTYGPPDGPITIEAWCTATHIMIHVSDRGPGVPLNERQRIFDRFYRLERDRRSHRSGSGLGLAICHGIITAHHGAIWVDDRPGGGSVFRIMLPITPEPTTLCDEE